MLCIIFFNIVSEPKKIITYTPAEAKEFIEQQKFWRMVGRTFIDVEDSITFIIVDVCQCNMYPKSVLFYKYYDVANEGQTEQEYEYSACEEIFNEVWSRFVEVTTI